MVPVSARKTGTIPGGSVITSRVTNASTNSLTSIGSPPWRGGYASAPARYVPTYGRLPRSERVSRYGRGPAARSPGGGPTGHTCGSEAAVVLGGLAEPSLDGLGLVHLLDDAQVQLVRVGQALDLAECLVLTCGLQ